MTESRGVTIETIMKGMVASTNVRITTKVDTDIVEVKMASKVMGI